MINNISIEQLSQRKFNRLLKKSTLNNVVLYTKLAVIVLCIGLIGFTAFYAVNRSFKTSSELDTIETQINDKISALVSLESGPIKPIDLNKIEEANIFGEIGVKATPVPEAPVQISPINADLKLVGTFIGMGDPMAIVLNAKDKSQESFTLNERVHDMATLVKIGPDYIELNQNGRKEVLKLDDGGGLAGGASAAAASDADSENVTVDSVKLDEALANLPLTLTQARAVPYFKNGKSVGLRMFAIKNGSLFQEIGLKNGDILKDINGNSLADITQAIKLFEKLKEERSLTLKLERAKKDVTYNYQIK